MEKIVERLKAKLWGFVEECDFSHGNAEVYSQSEDTELYLTMEGPRHTTLTVYFEEAEFDALEKDFRACVTQKVMARIQDFDVDDTFIEVWSRSFGEHNGFTPREFITILETDDAHFRSQLAAMLKEGV